MRARPVILRAHARAGALALAFLSCPAIAGESAQEPEAVVTPPLARVFLAAPIGKVIVNRMADIVDRPTYAVRRTVGSDAAVVEFSITRPPLALTLSAISGAPLLRATISSAFGVPRLALGGGIRAHAGIDLAAPLGSPVAAAMDGRVARAGWASGYGLLVTIDHGNGLETRYAHLSRLGVAPGQFVHRGDLIGLVGSTGHSTGPHLHYELRRGGRALDPAIR